MGVNGIYGLSGSGLDIESMVKVGMMSKQNEYDKMAQKYTTNEWTKNALIEINNQITTFNMSSLTDYKLSSKMNARNATSSNEAAVTATANATSAIMSHKVSVNSLSHNAYLIGSNRISDIIANTQYYSSTHTVTDAEKAEAETLASTANLKDILFKNLTYNDTESVQTKYNNDGTLTETLSLSGGGTITISTDTSGNKSATYYDGSNTHTGSISGDTITFTNTNDNTTVTTTVNLTSGVFNGNNVSKTTTTTTTDGNGNSTSSTSNESIGVSSINQVLSFDSGKQKITIDTDSSGNKKASFYDSAGLLGTHNYNGNGTVDGNGNTITFANGTKISNLDLSARSATVEEKASAGIVGHTMNSYNGTSDVTDNADGSYTLTGNRSNLVATYLSGKGTGSLLQLTDTAIEFTIADSKDSTNTATIKFTYGDLLGDNDTGAKPKTMNDLVSEINKQTTNNGINVKATYDNLNGVFSIYNPKGDDESSVVIKAVSNNIAESDANVNSFKGKATMNFFNALGLKEFDGTNLDSAKLVTGYSGGQFDATGENGTITVDGLTYKTKDNKVTVGGVTYNFLNTTAANEAVTVTVGQDVDAIVDRVKSFVESYNKILGDLYAKYDEKKETGYSPLTQTQKDQMKDEQIEKWEEKAKKGLLYHDQTLSKIITQMRNAVSGTIEGVDGKYNSIYSLGISTTGIKGQLVLDETKLKNALAEDGDSVYNVFAKLTTEDENGVALSDSESYNRSGIAQRLGDIFTSATKLIRERAGSSTDITEDSSLNNLLRELQTKMSNFKKLMTAFEDRLYKKYDAMEVTLSKLGSQLNFITGGQ